MDQNNLQTFMRKVGNLFNNIQNYIDNFNRLRNKQYIHLKENFYYISKMLIFDIGANIGKYTIQN
jgi:hypothetical protein